MDISRNPTQQSVLESDIIPRRHGDGSTTRQTYGAERLLLIVAIGYAAHTVVPLPVSCANT